MHVFISYSRKNERLRDIVIAALKAHEFKDEEIWWDKRNIPYGEEWFPEIHQALEDSFAVVVIITPESLQSPWVAYEWAWARGKNYTAVIPLSFMGANPPAKTESNPPLEHLNWVSCDNEQIPENVFGDLKRFKAKSHLVMYAELLVAQEIMPLRILASALFYCETRLPEKSDLLRRLYDATCQQAWTLATQSLPRFWLEYSHAFTAKQRRWYEDLLARITSIIGATSPLNVELANPFSTEVESASEPVQKFLEFVGELFAGVETFYAHEFNRWKGYYYDLLEFPRTDQDRHTAYIDLGGESEQLVIDLLPVEDAAPVLEVIAYIRQTRPY